MKSITIIGAGAVGRSLALVFSRSGVTVSGIYSEHGRSAASAAKKVKVKHFGTLEEFRADSSVIIIAVPDGRITDVSRTLASLGSGLRGKIVLHTSGALSSDELSMLRKHGASVGSFHPLQTFPKSLPVTSMKNIWFALEGDDRAISVSRSLAKIIGARTFLLTKKNKTLYHIAAVFASNYQVALFSVVEELSSVLDIPKHQLWNIFKPLITQTLNNVFATSPVEALTGPIARGDYKTISKHLAVLEASKKMKHLIPLYSTLGVETAKLAKRKNNAR
ncbi:MAG: Rossmann-like and DUF2520 domain-containing protein [Bacteroidota bacterium]|jgi:predicted short-subunit dehydrogenase-like oxidoreductase (DUF2520 family)